jgi:hypothetical protein
MAKAEKYDGNTVGLMINLKESYGTTTIRVNAMIRGKGFAFPTNPSGSDWSDERELDGLCLDGYVSEYDGKFNIIDVSYIDVHSVTLSRAKLMAKMLDKVKNQIAKDESREAGDVFQSFAKAIGATWFVEPKEDLPRSYSYSEMQWYWRSVGEGKEVFRRLISTEEAKQLARGVKYPPAVPSLAEAAE